jgi:hypothetical protein
MTNDKLIKKEALLAKVYPHHESMQETPKPMQKEEKEYWKRKKNQLTEITPEQLEELERDNKGKIIAIPTPKEPEEWKERLKDLLQELLLDEDGRVMVSNDTPKRITDFIQSLLSQKDKEVRKEIADKLERTLNEYGQVDVVAFIEEIKALKPTK